MPDMPDRPRPIRFSDGVFGFDVPEISAEEIAKRKWVSTKCGHVKRGLLRNRRLNAKTLEFALTTVGEDSEIGEKLKAGSALTEYERHLVVDVYLLHRPSWRH